VCETEELIDCWEWCELDCIITCWWAHIASPVHPSGSHRFCFQLVVLISVSRQLQVSTECAKIFYLLLLTSALSLCVSHVWLCSISCCGCCKNCLWLRRSVVNGGGGRVDQVKPSNCVTLHPTSVIYTSFECLNVTLLCGVKTYSDCSYIFSGHQDPDPSIYTPESCHWDLHLLFAWLQDLMLYIFKEWMEWWRW